MAEVVNITRSLQIARETVEQGVMLAAGHTAQLLVLIDDLEARLGALELAMLRKVGRTVMDYPSVMPDTPAKSTG